MTIIKANGKELVIINLQGRTFLPPLDCPFRKADEFVEQLDPRSIDVFSLIFMQKHFRENRDGLAFGWQGIASLSGHIPMCKRMMNDSAAEQLM